MENFASGLFEDLSKDFDEIISLLNLRGVALSSVEEAIILVLLQQLNVIYYFKN